jgi:hypothetical protein
MPTKDEIINFSLTIETLATDKQISYMDAIMHHCQLSGLEIELAAKLISGPLKSKIQIEAESLNYLPKSTTNKLPV